MALEIVGLVLGVIGLFGLPTLVWFFKHWLVSTYWSLTGDRATIEAALKDIAVRHSFPFDEPRNVATYGTVNVAWFVDLLSAVCESDDREILDRLLARWIHLLGVKPDKVAVPKLGNVILAMTVAQRLRAPLAIVRQEAKHEIGRPSPFDGKVEAGDKVLLVDDVASDGVFLRVCVERLRSASAQVIAVIVLVNRTEGSAATDLEKAQIPFHALISLGDQEIEKLRQQQNGAAR